LHTELGPEGRRTIRAGIEKMQEGQPVAPARAASPSEGRPAAAPANYNARTDSVGSRRIAQVLELLFGSLEFQRR